MGTIRFTLIDRLVINLFRILLAMFAVSIAVHYFLFGYVDVEILLYMLFMLSGYIISTLRTDYLLTFKVSERHRILYALSATQWRRGLDVYRAARVPAARFYVTIADMESEGLVISKWEEGRTDPDRDGRRRRLYKKINATGKA